MKNIYTRIFIFLLFLLIVILFFTFQSKYYKTTKIHSHSPFNSENVVDIIEKKLPDSLDISLKENKDEQKQKELVVRYDTNPNTFDIMNQEIIFGNSALDNLSKGSFLGENLYSYVYGGRNNLENFSNFEGYEDMAGDTTMAAQKEVGASNHQSCIEKNQPCSPECPVMSVIVPLINPYILKPSEIRNMVNPFGASGSMGLNRQNSMGLNGQNSMGLNGQQLNGFPLAFPNTTTPEPERNYLCAVLPPTTTTLAPTTTTTLAPSTTTTLAPTTTTTTTAAPTTTTTAAPTTTTTTTPVPTTTTTSLPTTTYSTTTLEATEITKPNPVVRAQKNISGSSAKNKATDIKGSKVKPNLARTTLAPTTLDGSGEGAATEPTTLEAGTKSEEATKSEPTTLEATTIEPTTLEATTLEPTTTTTLEPTTTAEPTTTPEPEPTAPPKKKLLPSLNLKKVLPAFKKPSVPKPFGSKKKKK
jgi:hypothetical protein